MNVELGIKLQAHLDGELTGREAQEIAALLEQNAEARGFFAELQQTKLLLTENEPECRLPESREFFWSKIEREIAQLETAPAGPPTPAWVIFLRRHLAAVTGTCVAACLVLFMAFQMNWVSPDLFEEIENPLDEAGAFSFRSESQQMTLVWIADPAAAAEETTEATDEVQ